MNRQTLQQQAGTARACDQKSISTWAGSHQEALSPGSAARWGSNQESGTTHLALASKGFAARLPPTPRGCCPSASDTALKPWGKTAAKGGKLKAGHLYTFAEVWGGGLWCRGHIFLSVRQSLDPSSLEMRDPLFTSQFVISSRITRSFLRLSVLCPHSQQPSKATSFPLPLWSGWAMTVTGGVTLDESYPFSGCFSFVILRDLTFKAFFHWGFPGSSDSKRICLQCRRPGFNPWARKIALGKGMATCSSILAWETPWIEEPGRLQSLGLQRVG